MIPKIIHYVWLGGGELPDRTKQFIEGWKELNPDYEIIQWDESNFDLSNSNEYVKQAYENKKYAFASDYIRLFALFYYGGIYLDTDVEVKKSFDPLLENKLFFGREDSAFLSTAVIGAEKNNIDIKNLLDSYKDKQFVKADGSFDITTNVERTSCYLKRKYNYTLKDKEEKNENLTIFPTEIFSPKDYITGKTKKTKNSIAIHHFEGSWDTKQKSKGKKIAKSLLKILPNGLYFWIINKYKNKKLKKCLKTL